MPAVDLPDADVLLVVPPLAHLTWPALGVHLLQGIGREAGVEVGVLYMNVQYAARIGPLAYADLANASTEWMLGDRLFARAAFDAPPLGRHTQGFLDEVAEHNARARATAETYLDHLSDATGEDYTPADTRYPVQELRAFEEQAHALAEELGEAIAARGYQAVGCSTTFDQTAASIALLRRLKARAPGTVTLLGGANCEFPMAEGVAGLSTAVDHVFAGESEAVFRAFLEGLQAGRTPEERIVRGSPCTDLDALPTPDFSDWLDQVRQQLPELGDAPLWLSYETSRGCWWGQKNHCTFCGLNGLGMGFREKSPERVIEELGELLADSPTRRVCMTDNIMPHRYHDTLVPRLPEELPGLHVFYEQKANLTLEQVEALYEAGSKTIQPGIESLDSDLLTLMRKGVKARQNVALLRYARSVGMAVKWNLLWGLPGDDADSYRRMLDLLPLLRHLCPPNALTRLSIDRFSPYFEQAEAYGVSDLQPLPAYAEVFPDHADLPSLAYHFTATYQAGSEDIPEVMAALNREVWRWRAAWEGPASQRPALWVTGGAPGRYLLVDTRDLGGPSTVYLDGTRARAVLVGGPRERVDAADWALEHRYAADLDGWCCPLAVAPVPLLRAFEADRASRSASPPALQTITVAG